MKVFILLYLICEISSLKPPVVLDSKRPAQTTVRTDYRGANDLSKNQLFCKVNDDEDIDKDNNKKGPQWLWLKNPPKFAPISLLLG